VQYVSESLIERYIAFPETLDVPTRTAIEARLRVDATAREIADFYQSFYAALRDSDMDARGLFDNARISR
jgi:hypothetical protein